jgi:hypothetical protein
MIKILKPWIDLESFVDTSVEKANLQPKTEYIGGMLEMRIFIWRQLLDGSFSMSQFCL